MNGIDLAAILGVVLALVFAYIPGLNDWYAALDKKYKQISMGVMLIAALVANQGVYPLIKK